MKSVLRSMFPASLSRLASAALLVTILGGLSGMSAATAAPITACSSVSDVTALAGSCKVGASPLTFSDFTLTVSAGFTAAMVGIGSAHYNSTTDVTHLDLQIAGLLGSGSPAFGDVMLQYLVHGPLHGIDLVLQATPVVRNSNVTITEIACSVKFVNGVCLGTTYANLLAISHGDTVHAEEAFKTLAANGAWIMEDIQFNGATTSEFSGSYHSAPEPGTGGLVVLSGLCGAALVGMGRRRRGMSARL